MIHDALESEPDDQQVILEFANSHGYGRHPDRLADGPGLLRWLEDVAWLGAPPGTRQITDADCCEARELRGALVQVLLSNARDPHAVPERVQDAEALLRRAGDRYPLAYQIGGRHSGLRAAQSGIPGVFGQIVASLATLSLSGQWPRMKACRNAPCHRAFIDNSRNTSAAYCRPQCSSAASMRAHRARQREEHDNAGT